MDFVVTDYGIVAPSSFHDGYLVGLAVGEKSAQITVKNIAGEEYKFSLFGVSMLRSDEFREGNIISRIVIATEGRAAEDAAQAIHWLVGELHPEVQEPYIQRHHDFIAATVAKVQSGALTVFYIEPCYGCELAAVCVSVQLDLLPGK